MRCRCIAAAQPRFAKPGWDVRRVYCDGDVTVYADISALVPTLNAPTTHRYIGPVLWSRRISPPPWWSAVSAGSHRSMSRWEAPGRRIYCRWWSRRWQGWATRSWWRPREARCHCRRVRDFRSRIRVRRSYRSESVRSRLQWRQSDDSPGACPWRSGCRIASNLDQYLNIDYIQQFGAGILLRGDHP